MTLAGRDDVVDSIAAGRGDADDIRIQRAFLTYLNAVLDELARGYFPLDASESFSSPNGRFALADFARCPVAITRVTWNKEPVKWHIYPDYLTADAENILVEYEYAPDPLGLDDEFGYPVYAVGARLVECGMVAEYFLVSGDGTGYTLWENKYRDEIERLLSRSNLSGRIPPRRWI